MGLADGLESGGDKRLGKQVLGKLAELLERSGIDVEEVGRVHRINAWQGFYKDAEGNAQTVDLAGIQLSPKWAEGPEWPVVQPAAPTVIRHRKTPPCRTDCRITVVLPDPQIGYWRLDDGTLIAMHDERAMAVALSIMGDVGAHAAVNLGDFLDLAEWSSKFTVLPEFVQVTQPAIDRGHLFLAQQRAALGEDAEIVLIGGNHDDRIAQSVARNAKAALRLRQANTPESWPVLSLPHLLRLDELGVRYIGAYPAGRYQIAPQRGTQAPLVAIHGERLDVAKVAKEQRQSFIQGHAHHVALHSVTYEVGGEPIDVEAWSMGCLCRVDGAVPSTKGGSDDHGRPVKRWESWQQAIAVVTEDEHGWDIERVRIRNGAALFRGRRYTA